MTGVALYMGVMTVSDADFSVGRDYAQFCNSSKLFF